MKKRILLFTASLFTLYLAANSQTRIGISGGISVADMRGPAHWYGGTLAKWGGEVEASGKAGFIGSMVLETPVFKSISFRPTLSYVQKSTSQTPPGLADNYYIALRYAEFTTDFLYYIDGYSKGGFFIGGGPSVAFDLPSKRVTVTDGKKTTNTIRFGKEFGNDIRGVDFGANYTLGWRAKNGFFFAINHNRGHRNLTPEGSPAYAPESVDSPGYIKNSYFGFHLGVFLNNGNDK